MTHHIPRRTRPWARAGVALACTTVLALTGLPGLQGTAYAAKGKPCDQTYVLPGNGKPGSSFPWSGDNLSTTRSKDAWDSYEYNAPRQALDGLTIPSDPAEQARFLDQFTKEYDEYPENTPERAYARYKKYLTEKDNPKYKTFDAWLANGYILPHNNNQRGAYFEQKVVNDLGLIGPDWLCQEEIPILDKDGKPVLGKDGKPLVRKFDAVNYKTNDFLEFKAGASRDTKQDPANAGFVKDPRYKDAKITYVFGEKQTKATRDYLDGLRKDAGKDSRIRTYEHISTSKPVYNKASPWASRDRNMTPGGNAPAGGASRTVQGSLPTPKDMAEQLARQRAQDPNGLRVRGPGGVDFSTLELSYVGKPVKGQALNYAFSAKEADQDDDDLGWGGQEKAKLISDSFFTWLALTPDRFWVNLMPDQPDRIMDETFGKTDAGRVLLQADLEMKHDYAKDVDPRQGVGKKLSDAMTAAGLPCGPTVRNWIVPQPAKVRADENGIYILDAPLKVNTEAFTINAPNPNGECKLTDAQRATAERLLREIVVPDIEQKVNNAPAYADLRRVYKARVAAEYVRQQDQQQATDYRPIINSNNVAQWPVQAPNQSWTPRQTWNDYVKSFTQGDYSYPCEFAGQQKMCVVGGVDFSQAPKQDLSPAEFAAQHKDLPRSTQNAAQAIAANADNDATLLLGGGGQDDGRTSVPDPTPTPTPPTPGDTGKPTAKPTTPPNGTAAPAPSTPGGTGNGTPAPGHGPDATPSTPPAGTGGTSGGGGKGGGSLASTGTQVLGIAGAAAALLVAGAALLWWRRRRTQG
ncbi:LPXTG cell wall anchor domain-containing protein [Kitasatospora sp. NPDC097643]|uniref:LPXTG cell wall anchor domain-containing protein n=1 Tax=Kitasatospora sp. NPDC097643 TaxID=3157230 RepID=UPI0033183C7E